MSVARLPDANGLALLDTVSLDERFDAYLALPFPAVEVVCLGPDDFTNRSSEQSITLHRAPAGMFGDLAHFWVASGLITWTENGREKLPPRHSSGFDLFRRDLVNCDAKPVGLTGLRSRIDPRTAGLRKPWQAILQSPLMSGFVMREAWNEVALLWVTEAGYGAFRWHTTA